MPRTSTVVRLTGNYQASVPKALRDQLSLKLGDVFDASIERGAVVLRPKVFLDPGALAAARARRGIGVSHAYDNHTAARRLKTKHRKTRGNRRCTPTRNPTRFIA